MTAALFEPNTDPEAMAKAFSDQRFWWCAYIRVGTRENWEAAIEELLPIWQQSLLQIMADEAPAVPTDHLCDFILMLAQRSWIWPDRDACHERLSQTFRGMPLPKFRLIWEHPQALRKVRIAEEMARLTEKAAEQRKAEYAKQAAEALRRSLKPPGTQSGGEK